MGVATPRVGLPPSLERPIRPGHIPGPNPGPETSRASPRSRYQPGAKLQAAPIAVCGEGFLGRGFLFEGEANRKRERDTMTVTILTNIFEDPRWRPIGRRVYSAEIDGRKLGGVLATFNVRFGNYALNRPEMEDRLMKAKREGKIDEAFVIAVRPNGTGRYEFRRAGGCGTALPETSQQARHRRQLWAILGAGAIRARR